MKEIKQPKNLNYFNQIKELYLHYKNNHLAINKSQIAKTTKIHIQTIRKYINYIQYLEKQNKL